MWMVNLKTNMVMHLSEETMFCILAHRKEEFRVKYKYGIILLQVFLVLIKGIL